MSIAFVTGSNGFIGRRLSIFLSKYGFQCGGIGHGAWTQTELQKCGVERSVQADISVASLNALQSQIGTPEFVFHTAGGSSVSAANEKPLEDYERSVTSTAELLEWSRLNAPNTTIVMLSSAAIYGAGHKAQIGENTLAQPLSPYGHHKTMAEQLCASYRDVFGLNIKVARLFSVFGAGLQKQLLWDICNRLANSPNRLSLQGTGNELRDWVDVRDLVRALWLIATADIEKGNTFNVGTGQGTRVKDVAQHIVDAWQGATPAAIEFSKSIRPGDPFCLIADSSRLESLGFQFEIAPKVGFSDYVQWFQREGAFHH